MLRFAGITLSVPGRGELDPLGANGTGRVLPISSIRFVLAMWVVVAHFSIPILRDHKQMDILGVFRALVNTAFNGPAAVIVSLSLILRFHVRIGYPWTLNLFAFLPPSGSSVKFDSIEPAGNPYLRT
jgi:hypothetical protein